MADAPTIATNTPIWYDLSSTDAAASRAFYASLFGWTADVLPDPEAGGYGFFNLDGQMVAGVGPVQSPQQPTAWSAYIRVDDAAATAAAAVAAGGSVALEPMEVMGQGKMAFVADPAGATIGLWQPMQMNGVRLQGVPGSAAWIELHSSDIAASKAFHTRVFGWEAHDTDMGGMPYTEFKVGGDSVAGGMPQPEMEAGAGVPSYWLVYFAAADVDAATARAQELGATVLAPVMEFPGGRFSVLRDPQGGVFGLLQMTG